MCGRFTLRTPPAHLVEIFELLREPELKPRSNIAPTQSVAVIRPVTGGRDLTLMHCGLIPSWSKDPKMGARMINARAESVATKPAFRSAFKQRRCLIPTDGFYEWKKTGSKKQPYLIGLRSGEPFASLACGSIGGTTDRRSTRARSSPGSRTSWPPRFTTGGR